MEIAFFCADKEREQRLADAFIEGLGPDDVGYKVFKNKIANFGSAEAICMVGVKSLGLFRQARAEGKHVIYFDKGYFRHRGPNRTWEYWRISIDDHHPTDYVAAANHGPARWERISRQRLVELKGWRDSGIHIVYAGSSDKYHRFAGLPNPTEYAQEIVRQIRKVSDRKIIYRPKPTWLAAEPVDGAEYSGPSQNIGDALKGAWCLVTHGSNSAFEAIISGIPCIVLGNGIARPIAGRSLDDIEKILPPSDLERNQWLYNLAWCMFSEEEMRQGLAWAAVKPQFTGDFVDESGLRRVSGTLSKPNKAMLKQLGQIERERLEQQRLAARENKHIRRRLKNGRLEE